MLDILGVLAFLFIIISMYQEDIIKLRLWGAGAGFCFFLQFLILDDMLINVIGQGGLVIYGLYKAHKEIKEKKSSS